MHGFWIIKRFGTSKAPIKQSIKLQAMSTTKSCCYKLILTLIYSPKCHFMFSLLCNSQMGELPLWRTHWAGRLMWSDTEDITLRTVNALNPFESWATLFSPTWPGGSVAGDWVSERAWCQDKRDCSACRMRYSTSPWITNNQVAQVIVNALQRYSLQVHWQC